jgi:hypothetical protein
VLALSARIALAAVALLVVAAAPADGAAGTCPNLTVLETPSGLYLGEPLPASAGIQQAGPLGAGVLDTPEGADLCERRQTDVTVRELDGVEESVAVGVDGRPGTIFVLGSKCYGFDGDARWSCLREPLELDGRTYVATRYPDTPGERRDLPLGEPVDGAVVAGEPVDAVAIDGVDAAAAVGIAGNPDVAYVAVGTCIYERFDPRPLYDDLRRCLEAPLWFVFDPAGAPPGDEVTATADRPPGAQLAGATVSLARSTAAADVVPREAERVVVFTLGGDGTADHRFTVPELEPGRYEAVLACDGCAPEGGREAFPAGSLLVVEGSQASGGRTLTTIITIAIGVAFVGALALSIYMWRRGRAVRRAAGPDEPGAGDGQG